MKTLQLPAPITDVLTLTSDMSELSCRGMFVYLTSAGSVRCLADRGCIDVDEGLRYAFRTLLSPHLACDSIADGAFSFARPTIYHALHAALSEGRDIRYFTDASDLCRWMVKHAFKK